MINNKDIDLNKAFFNHFKHTSMKLYSYPIRVALYDLKLTRNQFIKILAKNGLIYEYYLLSAVLEGKASSNFNLHYFSHLYRVLNIPLNIDTLCNSVIRWNEIKAYKLEQRNINRVKRGLLPVNSLSRKLK
jgi:hypothetical protein